MVRERQPLICPVCMHDIPSLHAAYHVLNLLASSWQMRLQLGLWVEFVENANGWRLFVPEMGTPCQHGAAVVDCPAASPALSSQRLPHYTAQRLVQSAPLARR